MRHVWSVVSSTGRIRSSDVWPLRLFNYKVKASSGWNLLVDSVQVVGNSNEGRSSFSSIHQLYVLNHDIISGSLPAPQVSVQVNKLFVPTVLCVLLFSFRPSLSVSLRVVEDLPVGLNDVLLLFEIHLQHSFDQHEGDATLWRKRRTAWSQLRDKKQQEGRCDTFHTGRINIWVLSLMWMFTISIILIWRVLKLRTVAL